MTMQSLPRQPRTPRLTRWVRRLVLGFIFAAGTGTAAVYAASAATPPPHPPLAHYKLQGHARTISYDDYWAEKLQRMQFLAKDASSTEVLKNAREILSQAATRALQSEQARESGVGRTATFQEWLSHESDRLLGEALRQQIMNSATTPTQQQVATYYGAHRAQFSTLENYTIRFLGCFSDDPNDTAQKTATRQRAEQARAQLLKGADFDATFHAFANPPDGYQGQPVRVTANDVSPAVMQALAAVPDGGYSAVLANGSGFLVLRRIAHQPEAAKPLEQVRAQIHAILLQETRQAKWTAYQREQMEQLKPTINARVMTETEISTHTEIFRYDAISLRYGQIDAGLKLLAREQGQQLTSATRGTLINALLSEKVLAHVARKQGLDQVAEVRGKLQRLETMLLAEQANRDQVERLQKNIEVSEAERRAYYDANRAQMNTERETRIRLIRCDNPARTAARESLEFKKGQSSALQQAIGARARIRKGTAFETLMQELNGSDANWRGERDWEPYGPRGRLIDQAVEKMKPGEISEPVEFAGGYYLIQLREAREPRPMNYEEARTVLEQIVHAQKLRAAQSAERARLLKQHHFEIDEQALEATLKNL